MNKFVRWKLCFLLCSMVCSSALENVPQKLEVYNTKEIFEGLDADFYPIGWSNDGEKIAFLIARPNEARDERTWLIQLLNLSTNQYEVSEEIDHIDQGNINGFWKSHGKKVVELLAPHKIEKASFKLHNFPILLGKFRGEIYLAKQELKYGEDPVLGFRGIFNLKVSLVDFAENEKLVIDHKWEYRPAMATGVIGYLKNPKGTGVVTLFGYTMPGYEGPPHTRSILVGSAITKDF